MNEFDKAKLEYENIPIPEELNTRIQAGIRQGKENVRKARRKAALRRSIGSVAACFMVLVGVLNVSPTVAAAAADVPVLGGLFQVLTVRSYDMEKDQAYYQVNMPMVDADSELAERVNREIEAVVDGHIAEMKAMWEEYHQAYIATGGTEEEWAQRSMDVVVDYQIMSQTDGVVSFVVDLSQCSVNASQTRYYYNLDLEHDRNISLRDLLGEDWVDICNTAILEQIEASKDEEGFSYFFEPEEGGFTTVDEATSFYIGADGMPVVVFPEYSIAAGAAGIVEFVIA